VCFYDRDDDFVCLARDARKQIRKTPVTLIRHRRPPGSQDAAEQVRGRLKLRRLEGSRRMLSVLRLATGVGVMAACRKAHRRPSACVYHHTSFGQPRMENTLFLRWRHHHHRRAQKKMKRREKVHETLNPHFSHHNATRVRMRSRFR
jgi:hypothetical protein